MLQKLNNNKIDFRYEKKISWQSPFNFIICLSVHKQGWKEMDARKKHGQGRRNSEGNQVN